MSFLAQAQDTTFQTKQNIIKNALGVHALHIAETGVSAHGTFGNVKPAYTVVAIDKKPDVYKYPRASLMESVAFPHFDEAISVRMFAPEKFLRMAMNCSVGAFEVVYSPKQQSESSEIANLLRSAVDHYYNPSLLWDTVTGALLGLTNIKGEQASVNVSRAQHILRVYALRCALESGRRPIHTSASQYLNNLELGRDALADDLRAVWEWANVDITDENNLPLPAQLAFEKIRVINPIVNTQKLQRNSPGFADFANGILYQIMDLTQ